jgi:hypothetical protein
MISSVLPLRRRLVPTATWLPAVTDAGDLQPGGDGAIRTDLGPGLVRRAVDHFFHQNAGPFRAACAGPQTNASVIAALARKPFFIPIPFAMRAF